MNINNITVAFREFLMEQKIRYERRNLIPTLDLLIEDLDKTLDVDRLANDNEAQLA